MNLNYELLEKDIEYGLTKEKEVEQIIKKYFRMDWFEKLSKFHPMDYEGRRFGFEGWKYYFEIKSRRFNHDKYKTTIIGKNKIAYCDKYPDDVYFFIFVFEDGIFYYFYSYAERNKLKSSICGRSDRGLEEYKLYYHIPIEKLQKINI